MGEEVEHEEVVHGDRHSPKVYTVPMQDRL